MKFGGQGKGNIWEKLAEGKEYDKIILYEKYLKITHEICGQ